MKRGVKVLVIKAVCMCIDVCDINLRVSCKEAQCKCADDQGSALAA